MDKTDEDKRADDVTRELGEFARAHGLVLPNPECVRAHASRFVELGHCPCVDSRLSCPCDVALIDIERWGRCECGILIDPLRVCMLKAERSDS